MIVSCNDPPKPTTRSLDTATKLACWRRFATCLAVPLLDCFHCIFESPVLQHSMTDIKSQFMTQQQHEPLQRLKAHLQECEQSN